MHAGVFPYGDFTEAEKRLLERITDSGLRGNLQKIRQAAEDVWAEDSTHIVQFYTDHGIKHSERLARIVDKLLKANNGTALSQEEMYLLMAGIYLHDIGMQCDILGFPEIKLRAEKLGAKFGTSPIERTKEGVYSLEAQKVVRKNHQYLTAAWIDYAIRSKTTTLAQIVDNIPNNFIDDLIDICKYHSKLPISDCDNNFKFNPHGRKRLIASLLRLSDELDIDAHRVTLATVKNFSFDPHSGVYWWLHNRTDVFFISKYVVRLTVRLHPEDLKEFGSIINEVYLNEFRTKNRPILTVLGQHEIPIIISDDSRVIENDREDRLPSDIVEVLKEWDKESTNPFNIPQPLVEASDSLQVSNEIRRAQVKPYFGNHYQMRDNFVGRVNERKSLTEWLIKGDKQIYSLTAIGGMGKTSLAWVWLHRDLMNEILPGMIPDSDVDLEACRVPTEHLPDGVFWWSFYERESFFTRFIDEALTYICKDEDISEIQSSAIST